MSKFNHILITGATSGIGEALALYYASQKVKRLSLCGRNQERLEKIATRCLEFGCQVSAQQLDVADAAATKQWIEECNAQMPLNLVFANAGVATLEETSDNVRNTFEINVMGVVNTVLPTIDLFKQAPSEHLKQIVITSSVAGYHGMPTCPSYSASKACVKAWGEGLRGDLRGDKIKVSVVCPGFVRSGITDKNTCPMPFFLESEKAAAIIAQRIDKNVGLIAFPWPVRFAAWFMSILPNRISQFVYDRLPHKV